MASQRVSELAAHKGRGRGTYGYISNMAHPTLYRISGLWSVEERPDGERIPMLDVDIEDHNKQALLIVGPYYEVLARVITYHGWPGASHRDLTSLPGLFPAG